MEDIILFRIGERLVLTGVVLLIALVVMIGFWRTVQKVDLAQSAKLGVGGSFVLSTPVFVLLAIILYAWVSLEHPIDVRPAALPAAGVEMAGADAAQGAVGQFIGATAVPAPPAEPAPEEDPEFDRAVAQNRLRSVNCAMAAQLLSPVVEDDLIVLKTMLMEQIWRPAWGDFTAFDRWARALGGAEPAAEVLAVWTSEHDPC